MTLLTRGQIEEALRRLGELAHAQDQVIELLAVGGAVMVLAYDARLATHDVDAVLYGLAGGFAQPFPPALPRGLRRSARAASMKCS